MSRRLATLVALSALAVACGGSTTEPHKEVSIAKSTKQRDMTPVVEVATSSTLAKGNAAFAQTAYHALGEDPRFAGKNLFFSPYSISIALAMQYAGANGTTAAEMAKTLHYELPNDKLHPAFNALDLTLAARGESKEAADGKAFRLRVANSLWGSPVLAFEPAFLDTLAVNYGSGVRLTDFGGDPEGSRLAINDWVSQETETRIKDLIPPGSIQNMTRLVLVNAIYFNGAWQFPFSQTGTAPKEFTTLGGTKANVDTMSLSGELSYGSGEGYETVVLAYQDTRLAMTVIVPTAGTFGTFEAGFTADKLAKAESDAKQRLVNLTLPKFKIEGGSVSLRDLLVKLGMPSAFGSAADFSGITKSDRLSISDVIHKAFVSVDEKGTEAAAATAVLSVGSAAPADPPVKLDVNRPFLFFVRDLPTNTTIFAGRVVNPGA